MTCPVCGKDDVRLTHAKGFLEKKVYSLGFVRPFRCRLCRARFYRFSLLNAVQPERVKRRKARSEEQFSDFLKPVDDMEFKELIREISEAEKRMFGTAEERGNARKDAE